MVQAISELLKPKIEIEDSDEKAYKEMLKTPTVAPKTAIESMPSDIKTAYGTPTTLVGKLGGGLKAVGMGIADVLRSPEGLNILAGLEKNPYKAEALANTAEKVKQNELGQQSIARQLNAQKQEQLGKMIEGREKNMTDIEKERMSTAAKLSEMEQSQKEFEETYGQKEKEIASGEANREEQRKLENERLAEEQYKTDIASRGTISKILGRVPERKSISNNVLTGKSKSGKDIFSHDGGKTWQYK